MKYAGVLMLAICLLVPTSAEARKRCRPVGEPTTVEPTAIEEEPGSSVHWARGNSSSWLHDSEPSWHHESASSWHHEVDDSWVHADAADAASAAESAAYDAKEGAGWVYETDYGWWAGVPDAAVNEVEGEDDERFTEVEEDCTVSKDRNECVVLANQVARYQFRLGLAIERDDQPWAENLQATIMRLEARAEFMGCGWAEQTTIREEIIETVNKVIEAGIVAARVYSMFYRMGLF